MFTQGPYLRVLTPRTTNGNNLMVNDNGVVEYKESHLPMSAKFNLEQLNKNTAPHLRKKIEVVHGNVQENQHQVNKELVDAKNTIELLQQQLAALQSKSGQGENSPQTGPEKPKQVKQ